jgi:hypothetical protein
MHTLIVKLKKAVPPDRGVSRLRTLVGAADLESVAQVFPGDTEPDTASLLELKVRDAAPVGDIVAAIRRDDEVEYVHEPTARRLLQGK